MSAATILIVLKATNYKANIRLRTSQIRLSVYGLISQDNLRGGYEACREIKRFIDMYAVNTG